MRINLHRVHDFFNVFFKKEVQLIRKAIPEMITSINLIGIDINEKSIMNYE